MREALGKIERVAILILQHGTHPLAVIGRPNANVDGDVEYFSPRYAAKFGLRMP